MNKDRELHRLRFENLKLRLEIEQLVFRPFSQASEIIRAKYRKNKTIRWAIEKAIAEANKNDVWITQNQACKIISRRKLEKAMKENRVRWKKTGNKRYSRVLVVKKDIEKYKYLVK